MRRSAHLWLIAVVGLLVSGTTSPLVRAAENPTFTKANQAFDQGRFQEAIDGYQELVRAGQWNAGLFYDLGNAWFRLGDFGHAILNYERALALEPRHPEAQANLRLARDDARALELEKNWAERYADFATITQYSVTAALALWVALFAIAQLYFLRRRSTKLVTVTIVALCFAAAAAFVAYTLETGGKGAALAVVTGKNVEARLATADNAKGVLSLPSGSQIKVLSERGDWTYAALPNGLRGWVPANSAERVRL
jgi:tetratricopeptide (TPR) repeat protein